MGKKRIVIVGFGFMGQNHAKNILKNGTLELAGIVDAVDPKIALKKSASGNLDLGAFSEEFIAHVPYFSDLAEAIAAIKPDAVLVAAPTMLHYKFAKTALDAGCNLFLEKPICLDLALCEELVALAKAKGLVFMAGHCVRFTPEFQFLKKAVAENPYGKPQYLHFSRYSGIPAWGCWTDPEVSSKSGGAMFDMAIHDSDCARALFGNPDELSMMPYLRERFGLMVVDSVWKYNNGPLVRVEAGFLAPPSLPFHREFTAVFENASVVCDMNGMRLSDKDGVHEIKLDAIDPYAAEIDAFAEYLQKGEMPLDCSGADAMATIRICRRMFDFK